MRPTSSMSTRMVSALAAVMATASFAAPSAAQTTPFATSAIALDPFEPLHDQHRNPLNVHGAEILGHLNFHAGLFLHYADDLLVLVDEGTGESRGLVSGQLKAEISGAIGFFEWVELGVSLPLVLYQSGGDLGFIGRSGQRVEGFAVGDLRVVPKGRLLDPESFSGFGLALALPMFFPSGDGDSFNGDGAFRIRPTLVMDWRHDIGFHVAVNLGYQIRPRRQIHNLVKDDSFDWSLGLQAPVGWDPLRIQASLHGSIQTAQDKDPGALTADFNRFLGSPMELDLATRYEPIPDVSVTAGVGFGVVPSAGAPDFRLFVGAGYQQSDADADGDGILDEDDRCPEDPEDFDDFEDSDGCPDFDHDRDRIPNDQDKCPDDPEDADGFQDEDGCPEPDNDEDQIKDTADQCPFEPEDRDGFEDIDGCPDPDNDRDGILDTDDLCPDQAEDADGYHDDDGCVDPDNDEDGIVDTEDQCPDQPEVVNGIDDEDGCPDGEEQQVQVRRDRIVILQKVHFATNKATIKKRSHRILGEVATVLGDNGRISKVRIEGHTDSRGPDEKNMKLSQARADAVRDFLVERGVAAERLVAQGYGETQPIDSNHTGAGRAANRRVEFDILEVDGTPVDGEGGP